MHFQNKCFDNYRREGLLDQGLILIEMTRL